MGLRRLAIVCAMQAELHELQASLQDPGTERHASRDVHLGVIAGQPVVLALSGIGKVAAAATTCLLLDRFEARALLFTGVAGGLGSGVGVGDVVIASELLQHDMDASPLFPRYEVPLTGRSRFACDAAMGAALGEAAVPALAALAPRLRAFGIEQPRVHGGLIISGDRFVASAAQAERLKSDLPDALAVEMEGAAAAQVCADFGVPCAVLRTVSDRADDQAHVDFLRFIDEVASALTRSVVEHALPRL